MILQRSSEETGEELRGKPPRGSNGDCVLNTRTRRDDINVETESVFHSSSITDYVRSSELLL